MSLTGATERFPPQGPREHLVVGEFNDRKVMIPFFFSAFSMSTRAFAWRLNSFAEAVSAKNCFELSIFGTCDHSSRDLLIFPMAIWTESLGKTDSRPYGTTGSLILRSRRFHLAGGPEPGQLMPTRPQGLHRPWKARARRAGRIAHRPRGRWVESDPHKRKHRR